jgi:hypothetical protein
MNIQHKLVVMRNSPMKVDVNPMTKRKIGISTSIFFSKLGTKMPIHYR